MGGSHWPARPVVTIAGLVREIRPWQWYKQGVMLLGVVFSGNLLNADAWLDLTVGIVSFTALAGAIYVVNDISDVEADRNHPEKRHRPIASGDVSIPLAAAFGGVLAAGGLAGAASLGLPFLVVSVAYAGQNVLYSAVLKEIPFVDVIVVAVGFVLRAIAGVVAIQVVLSPWLIVCTFLLALVLAIGKRRSELEMSADAATTRSVLDTYTEGSIDQLLVMVMATLLLSYSLYTFSRTDPIMMVTLPFAFYGVFRYHYLVRTTDVAGRPEFLLTDLPSVLNLLVWGLVTVAVLYDAPARLLELLPY